MDAGQDPARAAQYCSDERAEPGATRCQARPPAPSPPYWPYATKSSRQSSPASAAPDRVANPPLGHPSTATTKPSASTCTNSSSTCTSTPSASPHRQQIVDHMPQVSSNRSCLHRWSGRRTADGMSCLPSWREHLTIRSRVFLQAAGRVVERSGGRHSVVRRR